MANVNLRRQPLKNAGLAQAIKKGTELVNEFSSNLAKTEVFRSKLPKVRAKKVGFKGVASVVVRAKR